MRTIFINSLIALLIILIVCIAFKKPFENWIDHKMSQHILDNPHIIHQSMKKYYEQKKIDDKEDMHKNLALNRDAIFKITSLTPILGNIDGTQTMVVFMEPLCPHCHDFDNTLNHEIAHNKNLKIIVRDVPFFGEKSQFIIKLMLASSLQGQGHQARKLVTTLNYDLPEKEIINKFSMLKLDIKQLIQDSKSQDIQNFIDESLRLTEVLKLESTPSYIIKDNVYTGASDIQTLESQLKQADKARE